METEKTNSQYALDIISGSNDRDKERLVKIIIALIITIVLIVGGFLLYLNQYDFTALAMEGYGSYERRGRDSMGRYSREYNRDGMSYRRDGYSRDDAREEYTEKLRRMMDEAPDQRTREAIERMMDSM